MSRLGKEKGFTLLELMVALAIFAMLAMTGWQIMDSLTKSRDRAKIQIHALSELQFAYLQLSQDFAQTSNYATVPIGMTLANTNNLPPKIPPTFTLNSQGVVFKRFAMPDPRLVNPEMSPAITQVGYQVVEDKLIKTQWDSVAPLPNENAKTSVLLAGISGAKWTALTPTSVTEFPDIATLQKASQTAQIQTSQTNTTIQNPLTLPAKQNSVNFDLTPYQQLPKGVQLEFTYQDEPIVWRFALPAQAPTAVASPAQTNSNSPVIPSINNLPKTSNSTLTNSASNNPAPSTPTNLAEREDYR